MIIESNVITDLHIRSVDDLYKLKPLVQEVMLTFVYTLKNMRNLISILKGGER
jgi:hypothetical protein